MMCPFRTGCEGKGYDQGLMINDDDSGDHGF